MNTALKQNFLTLVRLGIGHGSPFPEKINWQDIKALAERQGLFAVVLDGIENIPNNHRPPQDILLQWIGTVLQEYNQRYELYREAIANLAGFYNKHGYKMMVLKGYACCLDWPKPEHRPCGDIDIWQFGKQKEADAALAASFKIRDSSFKIDTGHHHHTVFEWQRFTVENHYDFVNVHHSKSNAEIEKVFKDLGKDESYHVEVLGEKVYLPSPDLHALFLLRHAMIEFAASGISIRHVLDWAFFVEKHTNEISWKWLESVIDEYHMRDFYNCINAICVDDLGFNLDIFPSIQFLPGLKDKVLNDILDPAFPKNKPKDLYHRIIWKTKRWKANRWKHDLCYKESMCSAFWRGVWNHLLKPASI